MLMTPDEGVQELIAQVEVMSGGVGIEFVIDEGFANPVPAVITNCQLTDNMIQVTLAVIIEDGTN